MSETVEERVRRRLGEAYGYGHDDHWGPVAVVMAEELARLRAELSPAPSCPGCYQPGKPDGGGWVCAWVGCVMEGKAVV